MLENRDDYEFLTENALKRINIKGAPYPLRSQKLVITGEDEAYLREAMLERRYIKGMSADKYNSAILRITRELLRAKWLYDPISTILQYSSYEWIDGVATERIWIDKDEAENFGSRLPQGAVISITGELVSEKPGGVDEAIQECSAAVAEANSDYGKDAKDAFNGLREDLDEMYEERDEKVSEAQSERDSAVEQAQSRLESDLAQMKSEHDAAVDAIWQEYQRAMEDPDADHNAARKKYEDNLLTENNDYAMNVSARKDKARLEKAKAEDDYRKAVWDAECDLYDKAKKRYAEYAELVAGLVETRDEAISSATRTRNSTIQSIETGALYSGYLIISGYDEGGVFRGNVYVRGDGVTYSNALLTIEDMWRGMTIGKLCLGQYLRKTPLLVGKPKYDYGEGGWVVDSTFFAHAPSSDATMRAYADLERLRCCSVTPPKVYRSAWYQTTAYDPIPNYYDETRTEGIYHFVFEDKYLTNAGDYSLIYSSTEFAVYYGKKDELPMIDAIYATVRITRGESAYDGSDDKTTSNRTVGFIRVRLEKGAIQCESDLDEIDQVRKDLADTLAHFAEIRDEAYKIAGDAYYLAIDRAEKAYEEAVAEADKTLEEAKAANQRAYMASMEAAEKTFNTTVAEAEENEDIDDDERRRRIRAAEDAYNAAWSTALTTRGDADWQAQQERSDAVAAARRAQTQAEDAARRARSAAYSAAAEAYRNSTDGLAQAAEERIYDIKQRPAERRRQARQAFDDAVDAAVDARTRKRDAASDAFDDALHSLTVDGVPILPDHEAYLRYTPTFPNRTLTDAAYDDASQAERDAFYAAFNAANAAYTAAVEEYNEEYRAAEAAYWQAKRAIEDIREDARCRWTFTPSAVDSAALSLPSGEGSDYESEIWMAGVVHFDVVYKPKSLTDADFAPYYAELDK